MQILFPFDNKITSYHKKKMHPSYLNIKIYFIT